MLLTAPQFILICMCLTALSAGGTYWIMMRRFDEWIRWRMGRPPHWEQPS